MNIVELFARIGLKTDEDKAKSFSRAMNTVKVGLIAATTVATGTALAIRKITSDAMASAVAFKQFETETGASAQTLQKWQSVAEQTNQSAEAVTDAIKSIVSNQEKIKLGQGNISGFQLLGIDPRQDPFKILEELRDKTKGLSDGMKKNILSQIGVGAGLLQTLKLTRAEFDEMAGRAWIISPEAIETLNQTKSAMDLAGRAVNYMKTQIAVGLSPQIKKITKDFQEWMKINEKGIIEGFKKGFEYVTMFVKAGYNAARMLDRVIGNTIGWKNALYGVLGVVLALNAAFWTSPIGLITAGVILLIAVLDDLYTYSQGGKSLFGELMKEFPKVEKALFGSFAIIKEVFELLKGFASGDQFKIDKITKEWGYFGKIVKDIYTGIKTISGLLTAFTNNDDQSIQKITKEWGLFGEAIQFVYENFKKLKEFYKTTGFGFDIDRTTKDDSIWGQVKSSLVEFDDNAKKLLEFVGIFRPRQESGQVNSTQHNNINVSITGAGDPVSTGNAAAKAIQREINAASAQLSRNQ